MPNPADGADAAHSERRNLRQTITGSPSVRSPLLDHRSPSLRSLLDRRDRHGTRVPLPQRLSRRLSPDAARPTPQNRPITVGPEPHTSACRCPPRARRPAPSPISGRSDTAAGLQVVDHQLTRRTPADGANAASSSARNRSSSSSRPAQGPSRSASRYTSAVESPNGCGTTTTARARRAGSGVTSSPAPDTECTARDRAGWARRTQAGGDLAPPSARSTGAEARRGTEQRAAASAEPPPMPAATGIRLSISTRSGGAPHPAPLAQRRRARR